MARQVTTSEVCKTRENGSDMTIATKRMKNVLC